MPDSVHEQRGESPGRMRSPGRFAPGRRIGPYTLMGFLGSGGFGEVWLAERQGGIAATRLALKLPHDHRLDLDAIRQEAALWVQAGNHPNVLPLFEADIYDGQVVLASEYTSDGSLGDWLRMHNGSAPSPGHALEMAIGIASGLQHLHARGIVHRDLKPANVLMQGGVPRIADFGIARLLQADIQTTAAAGTPAYMAPEVFSGKRSVQTDIWSAGVILYQLFVGRLPFVGSDVLCLMQAITAPADIEIPPSIPDTCAAMVARALKKNPAHRYRSAVEMKAELQAAAQRLSTFGGAMGTPFGPVVAGDGGDSAAPSPSTTEAGGHVTPAAGDPRFVSTVSAQTPRVRSFLTIANGPRQGTEFELILDRILIGRSEYCEICLQSPSVSKNHVQLVRRDDGYSIEDLHSANGCFVNGRRVASRQPLATGDRVHVGDVILLYRDVGSGACGQPAAGAASSAVSDDNLVHRLWDKLDADLQDALALAFNQARREGKDRISTRTFFAAVGRLRPVRLAEMLSELPAGSMPESAAPDIPVGREILEAKPLLSSCVQNALGRLGEHAAGKLRAEEVFVDVAKFGTGESVARLRAHGITPQAIDRLVDRFGWQIARRT